MRYIWWLVSAILMTFLSILNASAQQITCEYDANEEWPWLEDRVCQSKPALILNDLGAAGAFPVCVQMGSDHDGDGWGWENGTSCRVASIGGYPVCLDPNSDPEKDGWGFENGQSCVVQGSNPVNTFPECIYRAADEDGDGWGYENGASCMVTSASQYPQCSFGVIDDNADGWGFENGQSCVIAQADMNKPIIVLQQNFDSATPGQYSGVELNQHWNTPLWHLGFDQGRVQIVAEAGRGNAMQVTFPANTYGAAGASAFLTDLEFAVGLPKSYNELYVSYDVKFAPGFQFVRGGKMPGLCGFDNNQSPGQGCNSGGGFPDGYDGWSSRGMWRENGILENYVYHAGQASFFGDDEFWGVSAVPGQWHQIQHRVVLNTVGQADGILEAWFDGNKVLSLNDFEYRKTGSIGINLFYFSTFFGGNDLSWAPTADQFISYDNFRVATTSVLSSGTAASANNSGVNATPVEIVNAVSLNDGVEHGF